MTYLTRDPSRRTDLTLAAPPRAAAREGSGLPEALFTSLTSAVFLVLMAAVAAAAILYTQGG